jgi:hypothetical protein
MSRTSSGPSPRFLAFGTLLLAVAGAVLTGQALAADNDGKVIECELLGGDVVAQPPGSAITACCYENGCWICDAQGNDCSFEPAADRIGPTTPPGRPPRVVVPGLDLPGIVK